MQQPLGKTNRAGTAAAFSLMDPKAVEQALRGSLFSCEVPDVDLWKLGVPMVWKMLR